jgi:hypothetical protein
MTLRSALFLLSLFAVFFSAPARAGCVREALTHQRRDASTIQRLEMAWTVAFLSGDTEFEACLLTRDFTEIMSDGTINHLAEELALAQKNKGKPAPTPDMPQITIHLHGNVAVAYGISSKKMIDGRPFRSYYADYYVWRNRAWHAYFAQQTSFPVSLSKIFG